MTTLKRFAVAVVLVALSSTAALACGAGDCCDCCKDKPAATESAPHH